VLASSTTSGTPEIELEQVRAVEAPGVTHIKYRKGDDMKPEP
jgi:hypothetical protein